MTSPSPARRALVTGATGDIGSAIARRLAQAGCHVYIHTHQQIDKARSLAQEIAQAGGQATPLAFDVSHAAAVQAALEPVLAQHMIDIVVNNAGAWCLGAREPCCKAAMQRCKRPCDFWPLAGK